MTDNRCSVADCDKPVKASGWCGTHYGRWYRTGTTDTQPRRPKKARLKQCVDCGKQYETSAPNSKRCKPCLPAYQRAQNKRYAESHADEIRERHREKRRRRPEHYREIARQQRLSNPERQKEYQRRYNEKHRTMLSLRRRSKQFGMTIDMIHVMMESQGNQCAICLDPLTIEGQYDIDHCHTTGTIRGILCMRCNRGIGMLRDNYTLCEAAAAYLRSADMSLASGA
jgi:hypothetical protein